MSSARRSAKKPPSSLLKRLWRKAGDFLGLNEDVEPVQFDPNESIVDEPPQIPAANQGQLTGNGGYPMFAFPATPGPQFMPNSPPPSFDAVPMTPGYGYFPQMFMHSPGPMMVAPQPFSPVHGMPYFVAPGPLFPQHVDTPFPYSRKRPLVDEDAIPSAKRLHMDESALSTPTSDRSQRPSMPLFVVPHSASGSRRPLNFSRRWQLPSVTDSPPEVIELEPTQGMRENTISSLVPTETSLRILSSLDVSQQPHQPSQSESSGSRSRKQVRFSIEDDSVLSTRTSLDSAINIEAVPASVPSKAPASASPAKPITTTSFAPVSFDFSAPAPAEPVVPAPKPVEASAPLSFSFAAIPEPVPAAPEPTFTAPPPAEAPLFSFSMPAADSLCSSSVLDRLILPYAASVPSFSFTTATTTAAPAFSFGAEPQSASKPSEAAPQTVAASGVCPICHMDLEDVDHSACTEDDTEDETDQQQFTFGNAVPTLSFDLSAPATTQAQPTQPLFNAPTFQFSFSPEPAQTTSTTTVTAALAPAQEETCKFCHQSLEDFDHASCDQPDSDAETNPTLGSNTGGFSFSFGSTDAAAPASAPSFNFSFGAPESAQPATSAAQSSSFSAPENPSFSFAPMGNFAAAPTFDFTSNSTAANFSAAPTFDFSTANTPAFTFSSSSSTDTSGGAAFKPKKRK